MLFLDWSGINGVKMKYPECSNDRCTHNDKYLCKADGSDDDIVCKQGKADAIKKVDCSKSEKKRLKFWVIFFSLPY